MRVRRDIAWLLVLLGLFTAGLLRQFHAATYSAPRLPALVGGLPFALIVVVVLAGWRERRLGAVGGAADGIRLGSLTPLLLMLFVEKWASQSLFPSPIDFALRGIAPAEADARFRALSGVALLVVALALSFLSAPARSTLFRRIRLTAWPKAALGTFLVAAATFGLLYGLMAALSAAPRIALPALDATWAWTFFGQGVRAFAEEVYFRGLLLAELFRLLPRLGLHRGPGRRWVALGITALLFGLEHVTLSAGAWRLAVFTVSLGVLFGLLVLVTDDLHYAAGVHALINWVLLGAVPRLVDGAGHAMPGSGTWVGLILVFAFVLAFVVHGRRETRPGL